MDSALRRWVRERAESRCEYCRLHQDYDRFYAFHLEHILARQHGGDTQPANLAWACHSCNLHKGPNLTGVDPQTGRIVELFHPRRDQWERHFRWNDAILMGRTGIGRATVAVLKINSEDRVELRKLLLKQGLFFSAGSSVRSKKKRRPQ